MLLSVVLVLGSALGLAGSPAALAAPTTPTWSQSPMPATVQVPTQSLNDVACPTAANCLAVGTGDRAFWLNGGTWQDVSPDLVPDSTGLSHVSCASSTFCVVLSSAALLVWNGTDWHTIAGPDGVPPSAISAVSCTAATFCAAAWPTAAHGGAVGRWNGSSWTVDALPVPGSNYQGNHWVELNGIDCLSPTACVAVGEAVLEIPTPRLPYDVMRPFAMSYNGTTWTEHPAPGSTGRLGAVSCWAVNSCAIVGTDFGGSSLFIYSNGTFHQPTVVGSTTSVAGAVACTSAKSCVAVGPELSGGNVHRWNGTAWHAESAGLATLNGVSCVGGGPCTAVGSNLVERGTGTWSQRQLPLATQPLAYHLNHVSCASTTWCAGTADESGPAAFGLWNGSTWTVTALAQPIGAIDCPSTTRCFGTSHGALMAWTPSGGWQLAAVPLPMTAVDCASVTSCVAVGLEVAVGKAWHDPTYKWNGTRWTRGADLVAPQPAQFYAADLSCPTAAFCLAVGTEHTTNVVGSKPTAATWNGSAWTYRKVSASVNVKQSPGFRSVDCTSATNCLTVGNPNGLAAHWDGSALTLANVPSAPTLYSVSCRTATSCVALTGGTTQYGNGGSVLWNGTSWTPLPLASDPAGPGVLLEDVDCTSTQCMGVGLGTQPNTDWNAEAELLR